MLSFSVWAGATNCWQPSISWQVADIIRQYTQAWISTAPFPWRTQGWPTHMPHPNKERNGRGYFHPTSQMEKWKAQSMKVTCLPADSAPWQSAFMERSAPELDLELHLLVSRLKFSTLIWTVIPSLQLPRHSRLACFDLYCLFGFAL